MSRRVLSASLVVLLFLSLFLAPVTIHGTAANHLLISEVLYDPASIEPGSEFIELYNPTDLPASLQGWTVQDNSSSDGLPSVTVAPGQFLVIASNRSDFLAANPGFSGALVALESPIGNGLSNSGDSVRLVDAVGSVVDALSYGGDATVFSPPCPDVAEGQALSRTVHDNDTDTASDWSPGQPSPGGPWSPLPEPTPTETSTASPTFTATRTATPSRTPSPTRTWTPTKTPSPTDSETAVPSKTPSPTASPTPDGSETPSVTPTPTLTPSQTGWAALLVSEVFYDTPQSGTDSAFEFVEIFNPTGANVPLGDWSLADNSGKDQLPPAEIATRGYLVIAASHDGFLANFPSFSGNLVSLEGSIGNGLSNAGDRMMLIAPDGTEIDTMSYGSDTTGLDPACRGVDAGESLARVPSGLDTDAASDWYRQAEPNPGGAGIIANTPTPTPSPTLTATRTHTPTKTASPTRTPSPTRTASATHTPTRTRTPTRTVTITRTPTMTPTASPTGTVDATSTPTRTVSPTQSATPTFPARWPSLLLSEVLYDPLQEGTDADWEFVELHNLGETAVTLTGWRIADNRSQDGLPDFILAPGEYAVVAAKEASFRSNFPDFAGQLISLEGNIGNGLSNTGDVVRLIAPDGSAIDAMSYGTEKTVFDPPCANVRPGESLARWSVVDTDSAADWVAEATPNPGADTTVTPTPTGTVTPTGGPSRTPSPTATRTVTRTPTVTPTPTALSPDALKVTLNEILPDPELVDWDRDGQAGFVDEWIELYNAADRGVSLEGWQISDAAGAYRIAAGVVIWPRSYLLLYRTQTAAFSE